MRFVLSFVFVLFSSKAMNDDFLTETVKNWNRLTVDAVNKIPDSEFYNKEYNKLYYNKEFGSSKLKSNEFNIRYEFIKYISDKYTMLEREPFEVIEYRHGGEMNYMYNFLITRRGDSLLVKKFQYFGKWTILHEKNFYFKVKYINVETLDINVFDAHEIIFSKFAKFDKVSSSYVCPRLEVCNDGNYIYNIIKI